MTVQAKDTGLGLAEFISSGTAPAISEGEKPTPAPEVKTEEVKAEAPKIEGKKEEVKPEAAKPETAKQEEKKEPPKEEAQKPPFDWESDDNPYKKRHADAAKWSNDTHQQNLKLLKEIEIIHKKLDGTYDPAAEAQKQPTLEEVSRNGAISGRVEASMELAKQMYGDENVQKLLLDPNSPFSQIEKDPYVQARVLAAKAPALEAMKILEERAFQARWGRDPREIEAAIRKKAEEELTATITEKVTKQLMDRVNLKEKQPTTLGDVRSAEGKTPSENAPKPLSKIFG